MMGKTSKTKQCKRTHSKELDSEDEYEFDGKMSVPVSPPPQEDLQSGSGCKNRNRRKRDKTTPTFSPSAEKSMTCAYCTYECAMSRQGDMKKHLLRRHPEVFFQPELLSSLSFWKNENFKRILAEVVFPEFILTNQNSTSVSCSICDEMISQNRDTLKMHLIDEHLQEVREHLKDTMEQSEASLQEKLDDNKDKRKPCKKDKHICKFCSKSFRQINNAYRHMKYYCPKSKTLQKTPGAGLSLSCSYCSYECANNRRDHMKNHLIHRHPEMFFQSESNNNASLLSSRWKQEHFESIVREIAIPNFIIGNANSSSSCCCSLCGKIYGRKKYIAGNRADLIIHVFNNHIEEVRKYLKDIIMNESDASLEKKLSAFKKEDNVIMDVDERSTSTEED